MFIDLHFVDDASIDTPLRTTRKVIQTIQVHISSSRLAYCIREL